MDIKGFINMDQNNINKIIDELSDLESFEISESGDLIPVNQKNKEESSIELEDQNAGDEKISEQEEIENEALVESNIETQNIPTENEEIEITLEEESRDDETPLHSENGILEDVIASNEAHVEKAKMVESLINEKLSNLLKLLESEKSGLEQQFQDFCKSLFIEEPCFLNKARINIHPISQHVEELHQKLMLIQDQNQTLNHKTIMGLAYYYFYSYRYYEGIRLLKNYRHEDDQYKIDNLLGNYYYLLGLTHEAKEFFLSSIKQMDDIIAAHFSLGFIFLNEEKYNKALYHLNRAEKNYAENDKLPILLAESYEHTDQKEKALFFYEKAYEKSQEPLILEKIALFSYQLKKVEKALNYFEQCQEFEISIKHLKYKKALCYYITDNYEESVNQLLELLNENRNETKTNKFQMLYDLIKRTFSLSIYDDTTFYVLEDLCQKLELSYPKVIEEDFNTKYIHNNEVLILLAIQFRKLKKYKTALKFLKRILKNNSKHLLALMELGKIYIIHEHLKEKGIEIFLYLEKLKKTDGEIDFYLGMYYFEQDQLEQVITYYLSAINKNFKNDELYKNLGEIYSKKEDYTQAITYFELAAQMNKQNEGVKVSLSNAYIHEKEYEKAIKLLKEIITHNEKNKEAHLLLSSVYRLILEDKSKEHYSKYLDL